MAAWQVCAVLVTFAFAPGVFWLWYFLKKDLEPEPLHLIRNCFLLGMAMVIPAYVIEKWINAGPFSGPVIVAPIVEESLKFLPVFLIMYRHEEFDEPMDGVIYAVAVALGFASLENVFYLYGAYQNGQGTLNFVTILRAFFSVPGHALFAVVWGYSLGIAKFSHEKRDRQTVVMGLLLGMTLHGVFNFLAVMQQSKTVEAYVPPWLLDTLGPLWVLGMMVLVPVMWQVSHYRIGKAIHASPHRSIEGYRARLRAIKPVIVRAGDDAWYQNRAVVIILMYFFCLPLGVYGLIRNSRFSAPEKASIIVLWIVLISATFYSTK